MGTKFYFLERKRSESIVTKNIAAYMDNDFSFKASFFQKALSFLEPVSMYRAAGTLNPFLELFLYRNQWQLATGDALYSDGTRYLPFEMAFEHIGHARLAALSQCLMLGVGLGSNIQILSAKYGCKAHFTLVELDEQVLGWCQKLLGSKGITHTTACCRDAGIFLSEEKKLYDLICMDVFVGKKVPEQFTGLEFLNKIRQRLWGDGLWVMNYMKDDAKRDQRFQNNIKAVFPENHCLEKRENIVYWGTA